MDATALAASLSGDGVGLRLDEHLAAVNGLGSGDMSDDVGPAFHHGSYSSSNDMAMAMASLGEPDRHDRGRHEQLTLAHLEELGTDTLLADLNPKSGAAEAEAAETYHSGRQFSPRGRGKRQPEGGMPKDGKSKARGRASLDRTPRAKRPKRTSKGGSYREMSAATQAAVVAAAAAAAASTILNATDLMQHTEQEHAASSASAMPISLPPNMTPFNSGLHAAMDPYDFHMPSRDMNYYGHGYGIPHAVLPMPASLASSTANTNFPQELPSRSYPGDYEYGGYGGATPSTYCQQCNLSFVDSHSLQAHRLYDHTLLARGDWDAAVNALPAAPARPPLAERSRLPSRKAAAARKVSSAAASNQPAASATNTDKHTAKRTKRMDERVVMIDQDSGRIVAGMAAPVRAVRWHGIVCAERLGIGY